MRIWHQGLKQIHVLLEKSNNVIRSFKMKNLSELTIYNLIIIFIFDNSATLLFNYTELMKAYYLLCGSEYFCYQPVKTHGWEISPNLSYRHFNVCPECKCDNACIQRGDCCADLYFSFPHLNCVNRTIINGRYEKDQTEQYSALMVDSCPVGSSKELNEKCASLNGTKSRLKHSPVTGNELPLTFYNKFCANCNNVLNYTSWKLDINCSLFADFNFVSTLDDVIDLAYERKCIFQTYRKDDDFGEWKEENCFDTDWRQTVITKCNQTSEWIVYDKNIAYACESFFKGNYRLFKNVFCYMCNPSGHKFMTKTIAACNVTGQWMIHDEGLQRACTDLPMTFVTAPFKNVFCYLCNRGNDSSQMFVDILGDFTEVPIEDAHFHYQYDLEIVDFNIQYFIYKSLNKIKNEKELDDEIHVPFDVSSFMINNGSHINMTNLLIQNAAIDGNVRVCESRRSVFPGGYNHRGCVCDILCFYREWAVFDVCCTDLALQIPFHCQDILDLSHTARSKRKGFLTMNGCFQEKTIKLIREGCLLPDENDIFSTIPLNKANGINYDNFYCILCNFESDKLLRKMQGIVDPSSPSINDTSSAGDNYIDQVIEVYQSIKDSFTIWSLEMVCPKYLDYSHYVMAGELIYIAKQIKCRIQFKTGRTGSKYCPPQRSSTQCANMAGWTYSDQDVEWGCKNVITHGQWWTHDLPSNVPTNIDLDPSKHYRKANIFANIFCALCRPTEPFSEYFVDNCTISDSAEACYNFPRTYYYYPFKNVHCLHCNNLIAVAEKLPIRERELEAYNLKVGLNWFPMLRNLFSITEDDVSVEESTADRCSSIQVYDPFQGICRNITCYSGKYLDGGICKPLLSITMNLRYTFKVKLGFYTLKEPFTLLTYPASDIQRELNEFMSSTSANYEQYAERLVPFDGGPGVLRAICIYTVHEIHFKSSISRIFIEKSLMDFKNRLSDGCNRNITSSNITVQDRMPTPNERKRRSVTNDSNLYFSAKVSKILFCPQIELEDDEYNISDSDSSMVLTRIGLQDISSNEFAFTPNGRMRVCLNYLQLINYLPIQQTAVALIEDLKQKYLWIISLVASIISIISLCLGLFIYSAFPSLRTIPGKLLMMMMMSLLLTLIFLQVSFFVVQTKYGCYGVAVVLHFLWISVFTSMQTSNYHMWRTFTSKEIRTKTSTRTLIWYGTYCVGVPFILVLLNTVISWIRYSNPFLGYGGGNCFIRDMYLQISLFVCPVGLICLFNIIFFSLTIHSIRTTPSADNNQQKRNELAIFARLATITGLSWLLQIVDSFLPVSYFTFVSTVINSLQGLLIFIAFVVNKRVWNLLSNNDRRKENDKILTPVPKIDSRTVHTKRSNDLSMTTSCASSNSKDVLKVNESTDPIKHSQNQVEINAFKNGSDGNVNKLLIHKEETQCESQLKQKKETQCESQCATKESLVNLSSQTSLMESHSEVRETGNAKPCQSLDDPDVRD